MSTVLTHLFYRLLQLYDNHWVLPSLNASAGNGMKTNLFLSCFFFSAIFDEQVFWKIKSELLSRASCDFSFYGLPHVHRKKNPKNKQQPWQLFLIYYTSKLTDQIQTKKRTDIKTCKTCITNLSLWVTLEVSLCFYS